MKGKIAGILISVLYLLSLFAGVTALDIHAVVVKPLNEASTIAPDSIIVKDLGPLGLESTTWTGDGVKVTHTFSLPHGKYDITVQKAGYFDYSYKNLAIDADSSDPIGIAYQLTAIPVQTYSVPVAVKDASGAALIVDSLTVKNSAGAVVVSAVNVNSYTFNLANGDYTLVASKLNYNTITQAVHVAGANLATITLTLTATSGGDNGSESADLTISNVDYEDEVKAGETMTFDVDVKNTAAYDAEHMKITVTVYGIDDGDDLDVKETFGTLDAGEHDTFSLSLDVPQKVEADTYTFDVKVQWEDSDAVSHFTTKKYTDAIEVTKEKHNLQITAVQLLSASIYAGKQDQVSLSILNAGKEDETARIKLEIPDLKVSVMSPQFKLKENDDTTQYVQFSIPEDAKPGKYYAYASVLYNNGASSTMEMLILEVKATQATTEEAKVVITPVTVTTQKVAETAEKSEAQKTQTTGLVIGVIIALLVLGMLYREFAVPKPTVIKAGRGGR